MYINPDRMTGQANARIDRWLVANGCTDYVDVSPIVVRGNRIHYTALSKRNAKAAARIRTDGFRFIPAGPRSVRIRVPLHLIP